MSLPEPEILVPAQSTPVYEALKFLAAAYNCSLPHVFVRTSELFLDGIPKVSEFRKRHQEYLTRYEYTDSATLAPVIAELEKRINKKLNKPAERLISWLPSEPSWQRLEALLLLDYILELKKDCELQSAKQERTVCFYSAVPIVACSLTILSLVLVLPSFIGALVLTLVSNTSRSFCPPNDDYLANYTEEISVSYQCTKCTRGNYCRNATCYADKCVNPDLDHSPQLELRHTTYVNKPVLYAGIALWGGLGLLLCAAICCFSICLFVKSKGEYKIKALFADSELRGIKYAIEILNPRPAIPAQQIEHYLIPELSRPFPAPAVPVPLRFLTPVAADSRTVVDSGSSIDVEARPELSMW